MKFISYAQNLEDVMLWRCLKDVDNGFYIDVGAAWPDTASVTKAFYLKGWRGINIEPNSSLIADLERERPEDINLKIAVSDSNQPIEMTFFEDPGLSTADTEIAAKHVRDGYNASTETVEARTLSQIWKEFVPDGQPVHFLKIDVEGLEEAVIRGNDWTANRPWVVVVEATVPMSQEESFGDWDRILTSHGYSFKYFDGLNRFYVAEEKSSLSDLLKYPPNVWDDYEHARTVWLESEMRQAQTNQARLESELTAMRNSRSWKSTRPLRLAGRIVSRLMPGGRKSRS